MVSFRYASRPGYAGYCEGRFYVEIDGNEVGSVDVGSDVSFRTAIMEAELSAGGHTLVIRHSKEFCTHSEKLSCSAIDGISITPKTGNLLFNGGFEGYMGVMPSAHWAAASASLNADGWSASGYGLSVAGSPFLKYAKGRPFEGDVALHFNGVQAASQNVEILESGFYDISFVYAPRNKPDYAGGRVHVWIDDAEVGYVDCPGTTDEFRRFMVRTHIDAGSHVFKLSHTCDNPVSASCIPCSAIDDVSLRVADAILMNGSFDESTIVGVKYADTTSPVFSNPGWNNGGSAGVAAAGSPFVDAAIPVGSYAMYLQTRNYGNGAASPGPAIGWQSFSIAAAGYYGVSFSYAKRKDYVDKVAMVRIRRGAGLDGEVVFEDAVTANTPTSFRQYSGMAKLSAAGEYTIEFHVALPEHSTVSNDGAAIIDNVSVDFQRKISGTMIVIK